MAVNDVVADLLPSGGDNDFQPASGVHIVISYARTSTSGSGHIALYDGSNESVILTAEALMTWPVPINNDVYLRVNVPSGFSHVGAYSGIQIK